VNFNIYLDKDLSQKLFHVCETTHKKRNTLIREALELYIRQLNQRTWPSSILNFQGVDELDPFEASRKELGPDKRSPFLNE
jgi:hypothetical protein